MIVIARKIARVAILHAAKLVGKKIPDAFATSVFVDRAFDLIA
jgi:hypothetical protein